MRLFRWIRECYLNRRYPWLGILPDGTIVRMRDGKVVGHQDPPS
jgi:hypothetical protein